MKKMIALALCLLMACTLLAGCGGSSAPAATTAPAANDAPAAEAPAAPAAPAEKITFSISHSYTECHCEPVPQQHLRQHGRRR